MRLNGPIARFGKCLAGLALAAPLLVLGAPAKADDALIVYGGLGNLSNKAQPIFSEIFGAKAYDGGELRRWIETRLRGTVSRTDFAWSAAPAIIYYQDANRVMSDRAAARGERWDKVRPTLADLADAADRLYLLAVVVDLEIHLTNPPHVEGADYLTLLAGSATALLVDFTTKEVVLSANDVRSTLVTHDARGLSDRQVAAGMATIYRNTSDAAVKKLADQMNRRSPSDAFDRHMVTGGIFPGANARDMFGFAPWPGKVKSVCELPRQCQGTGPCAQLAGLTTAVVSSALTNAGHLVLPPARWARWTARSSNLVALNLVQPRGGLLEEMLTFRLPPSAAEIKTIAIVEAHEPRVGKTSGTRTERQVWSGKRTDVLTLTVNRYTTDSENCAKDATPVSSVTASGTNVSKIAAGYTQPGRNVERLYILSALLNAKANLQGKLEQDG